MVDPVEVSVDTDNLNDFEQLLYGKATEKHEVHEDKEVETKEPEEAHTPETEDFSEDNETPAEVDDDLPEEEPEASDDKLRLIPKKKKSAKERIDEVVSQRYEVERERDALRRELEELRTKPQEAKVETPVRAVDNGPNPTDLLEDGSEKYPLGEFDPRYIRDLTAYAFEQEAAKQEQRLAQREAEIQHQVQLEAVQKQWNAKIESTMEEIPDLPTKAQALDPLFNSLPTQMQEYLSGTIMSMDEGPKVLNYLADNLDEARRISRMGAVQATIALGKIEASLSAPQEKRIRVSSAPEPPPTRARGTGGKFETPDDTDDLDAFEKKFYGR